MKISERAATEIEEIAAAIVDETVKLHIALGPGLLENVYETILAHRLLAKGLHVKRQLPVAFTYEGHRFNGGFRIDLLVNDLVLIEVKSIEMLHPVHPKQVLTYLKLLDLPLGILVNFGGATLKEGLRRILNDYVPSCSSRLRVNQSPEQSSGRQHRS